MTGVPDRMAGSTMTVTEATLRARTWWSEYRGAIRRTFNVIESAARTRVGITAKKAGGMGFPSIAIKDPAVQDTPSGILSGSPWEELTLAEQKEIRDLWHHNHVICAEGRGSVVDMPRAGVGKLSGTELSPTPHEGKPESQATCSTNDSSFDAERP